MSLNIFIIHLIPFHNPPLDVPGCTAEIHADAQDLATITGKRQGILFLFYLTKCLFSRTVKLELHHIDIIRSLKDEVDTTV